MIPHVLQSMPGRRPGPIVPSRLLRLGLALVLLVVSASRSPAAAPRPTDRTLVELQTDYIFNCMRFVNWPGEVSRPIELVVVDDERLLASLRHVAEVRRVRGREVVVTSDPRLVERGIVDMVFVGDRSPWTEDVIAAAASRPVLTVGEGESFTSSGGMLAFVRHATGIGVRVNMAAVRNSEIEISARLLVIAEIVEAE